VNDSQARLPAPVSRPALDGDAALRFLLQGTARETGAGFFRALVHNLAQAFGTLGAWVTEYDAVARRLKALAFELDGEFISWEGPIDGTPCAHVVEEARFVHLPDRLLELYPGDPDLRRTRAVSYMGVPLQDQNGIVIGHLAVLDTRPMPEEPRLAAMLHLFAERAAAELLRLRAEQQVREREERLASVVGGAMDAIVELDDRLHVTLVNAAAEKLFGGTSASLVGRDFRALLIPELARTLEALARDLGRARPGEQHAWIPGGVRGRAPDGASSREFQAEATLSCHRRAGRTFHTLILRDIKERLEAEARIRTLSREATWLREELRELANFEGILGHSPALVAALHEIEQVAETDASVLVLGETGTGKELVARAIHQASRRRDGPLVRLNCAAIPASLIESELFGHEKGAFTGATERREGRFALADGGTIFLDEIGELSLELQAKLLRVLQDGEFEPVGGSKTRRADVRVISATNRDLAAMRQAKSFREDLYHRLSVFPVRLPPLRERGDDVLLLAEHFAARYARKMGRELKPLDESGRRRLLAYGWPGNVRELANVIERAVITSRGGCLNLDRSLPEVEARPEAGPTAGGEARTSASREAGEPAILTAPELEALERENLRRALDACGWKISGAGGAAERLGLKPTTLTSRMKALDLRRPE
jgi:PAS domain S-box-containing protein